MEEPCPGPEAALGTGGTSGPENISGVEGTNCGNCRSSGNWGRFGNCRNWELEEPHWESGVFQELGVICELPEEF